MEKRVNLRLLLASALLPMGVLWYYYNRNATEIKFYMVLILAAVTLVLSLAIWFASKLVFRSPWSAAVMVTGFWILCFAYNPIRSWLFSLGMTRGTLFLTFGVGMVLFAALGFLLRKIKSGSDVAALLCALAAGMFFIMGFAPAVTGAVKTASVLRNDASSLCKTQFTVDESTKMPNIYWIHSDGMLGFDAFERYFGDSQTEFKQELADRGFEINEDAYFEALHDTDVAIPSLMCPEFYDVYLSEYSAEHADDDGVDAADEEYIKTATMKNELVAALGSRGYSSTIVTFAGCYYPPENGRIYLWKDDNLYLFGASSQSNETVLSVYNWLNDYADLISFTDLFMRPFGALETLMFPNNDSLMKTVAYGDYQSVSTNLTDEQTRRFLLSADPGVGEWNCVAAMINSIENPTSKPRFTVLHSQAPHGLFLRDENGYLTGKSGNTVAEYEGQHRYATKVTLAYIDYIIENDPDAVIVLQADHGLHMLSSSTIVSACGEGADKLLWNSVMSAVRVPEEYRTGEEDEAMRTPLNISRYLVNSFVGENYDYVASEDRS